MFVLRLTSNDSVLGLTTDDGFEIGRFTTATTFLLTVTAGLGGATGAAYYALRGILPRRGRAVLWAIVLGLLTGADLLKPRSTDFTLLEPRSLAVVSFVLLPAVAALLIALVVEHLLEREPWSNRPLTALLMLGALPIVPVFPAVLVLFGTALFLSRRPRIRVATVAVARIAVPLLLVALSVRSGVHLWRNANEIL